MLLTYQDYISEEILENLHIDYIKINGIFRLISNNIYYLNNYLEKNHNNFIQYNFGLKAAHDLLLQIKNYQDRGFTFLSFNLDEILIVDGKKFLLIPNNLLKNEIINFNVDINNLKSLLIDHIFIPPELRVLTSNLIHISANYYSIGYILLKIVFNDISVENLNKIKYTSLYYCIKRCIHENPRHRFLVLF
jgi:hypothetical protein